MKPESFVKAVILALFLIIISAGAYAQDNKNQKQDYFRATTRLTYLDGSPFNIEGGRIEDFDMELITTHNAYAGYVIKVAKDSITVLCKIEGTYSLQFLGAEITRFNVTKQKNKFISDLPETLHLPFNYLIQTPPSHKVYLYDNRGQKTGEKIANKNGYIFLKNDKASVSNMFFVCFFDKQFPQISLFREVKPKYQNELRFRKLKFEPAYKNLESSDVLMSNENIVHNINENIYYKLKNIKSNNQGKTYYWIEIYKGDEQKAIINKLDIETGNSKLFLDETGKPVITCLETDSSTNKPKKTTYFIGNNGSLQLAETVHVSPLYSFNGHYVGGQSWAVPTFMGIAMDEGQHTITITCQDKKGGSMTSTSISQVVFSPENEKLLFKNSDGKLSDYPIIQDPNTDFSKLGDIKQCLISVDGSKGVDYTHVDMDMAKGIFYSDMSEKEKLEANKNLPLNVGWDEDDNRFGYGIDIFQGSKYLDHGASGPINKVQGPYPELRYRAFTLLGEYPTYDEAKKQCKQPSRWGKNYQCIEEHIVSVCLDNYRYTITDGYAKTDNNALFCGEPSDENDNKGDAIIFEVSASGYVTETRALSKHTKEASDITLTGKIIDTDSLPVIGAKISFRGVDDFALTDSVGKFSLKTKGSGKTSYSENSIVKLQKIGIEIINDTLGASPCDTFGIVSDGFTTLKLKVKAKGIKPETVIIKPPALGDFVGQTWLKIPLVLNDDGTGVMEYVPPAYLSSEQLTKHLKLKVNPNNQYGLSPMIWVAEVPITMTYEDEEGNQGSYTFTIFVTRPPVMLVHGFTGDETTWATLANYLRVNKYEPVIREYYQGSSDESTIERQAEKLHFYIQKIRESYLKNHFIQARVDIVAHSMGGLISRYYINNMPKYGKTAGIYIPYDVKLSKDELKAARFKKPVILNDVRKLIMVGTPNHGSSYLDVMLGRLSALLADYHQIAATQLQYNSPFFSKLNAGEQEGTHLDPNVQYALLYGIRQRSALYPPDRLIYPWQTSQKEFVENDGVVTSASAQLNGVVSYRFPKDLSATHGYIHSPALKTFFNDEPITESETVFEKITDLLQEDISRVPLKGFNAKIVRAYGDASFRYFSTESWEPVSTPISGTSTIKLKDNWCQLKTGEGNADVGFFLNNHHWGTLHILPNTVAYYEFVSTEFIKVYLQKGRARFQSRKREGGGFEIVLGKEGEKWYAFNPKTKIRDVNTDFTVEEENGSVVVQSMHGEISIGINNGDKEVVSGSLVKQQGMNISETNKTSLFTVPANGWWSNVDTTFLPDDTANIFRDSTITLLDTSQISITCENEYLPVSGFTNMQVHLDTLPDTLLNVELDLDRAGMLPFIHITNKTGNIDSLGNFNTNITISEPDKQDYNSLKDILLTATFKAKIIFPPTGQLLAEKQLKVPIGMVIIHGQTLGIDYKPRKEPAPPELFPTRYQLMNEVSDSGNFYILFNTTLYNNEIIKQQKYAQRTQQKFDSTAFRLSIKWPESSSMALTYTFPDSITTQLKAGKNCAIGKNGFFDLLTSKEQELRLKKYVEKFAENIPLEPESKAYLFDKLNKLSFRYNVADINTPTFEDNMNYKTEIEIPCGENEFWGANADNESSPAYVLIFHVLGHFLQQTITLPNHRYYNFLSEKCSGSKNIWIQQRDELKYMFDNTEYISFSEAGADFFAYLLMKYLEKNDAGFTTKSIYYREGFLSTFTNKEKAMALQNKFQPWLVSGSQTSFLVDYYGDDCKNNPTAVYSDFLFNSMQYYVYAQGGNPASTFNEWVVSKYLSYKSLKFAGSDNPVSLANKYGLINKEINIKLVPTSDFRNEAVLINGNMITDFSQIPAVSVVAHSKIEIDKGIFKLMTPSFDTIKMIEIKPGSKIEITDNNKLTLTSGTFHFNAPVSFNTTLASFEPVSNNFIVTVAPKETTISVFDGSVKIVSLKDEDTVLEGFGSVISKSGRIKKPKLLKKEQLAPAIKKLKTPFIIE